MNIALRNGKQGLGFLPAFICQLFLSVLFMGPLFAYRADSQEVLKKRISLKIENQSVKKVLIEIEKNAEVRFIYNPNLLKSAHKVNLTINNLPLGDVLTSVLEPLQLGYRILGKQIVLNRIEVKTSAMPENEASLQPMLPLDISVKGQIKDDKNEAIVGASIIIKGLNKGTTTDAEGRFSLSVPNEDAVLIVSFIGYESQELAVGKRTVFDVVLKADLKQLEEIVVVGYGEIKKTDLTGAVASVQTRDIVRANPVMASKAIQGQVAGATVTKSSNKTGGGLQHHHSGRKHHQQLHRTPGGDRRADGW